MDAPQPPDARPAGYSEFTFLGETPLPPVKDYSREQRKANWGKFALRDFEARHTKERKARDAARVAFAHSLAAKSPVLKQALDWADAHDVTIIIDEKVTNAYGYYTPGNGVVALQARLFEGMGTVQGEAMIAGVLAHELRHAWQEFSGISTDHGKRSSADYTIMIALIEADAMAHEKLADAQYRLNSERQYGLADTKDFERRRQELEKPEFLQETFRSWYPARGGIYGENSMRFLGSIRGIPGVTRKQYNAEFIAFGNGAERKGIDFTRPEQLRKLGQSFTGVNYFDGMKRDEFDRFFLSPGLSRQFFNTANKPDSTALALRKNELKAKAKAQAALRRTKFGWGPVF